MDQVSNIRIMNRGTPMNILTQLGMTADGYNLVNTVYYVRSPHLELYSIKTSIL